MRLTIEETRELSLKSFAREIRSTGPRLSRVGALELAQRVALTDLLDAASNLRDKIKGRTVTYSRKVFIPLTYLCRDYCGYCTFRRDPSEERAAYLSPAEVLAIGEAGSRAGCKEALFTLGDQPERVFPEARAFLKQHGFERTIDYLVAMSEMILEKTGLLPHSNPGLMDESDMARLKQSNASLGLMLESVSKRLLRTGQAHWKAPDKVPELRLRTLESAGKLRIPFTTGILVGIGETMEERIDSLLAIRDLHDRYGHIQEVLVQPFRAKPGTRMEKAAAPSLEDLQRTLAISRLILGEEINVQTPPNLTPGDYPKLLGAGINDWGGISPVTKDFVNPEAAWPQIRHLTTNVESAGFVLRERLAVYPEFALRGDYVHSRVRPYVDRLVGADGYARVGI